jgi:translation initiation factor 4E
MPEAEAEAPEKQVEGSKSLVSPPTKSPSGNDIPLHHTWTLWYDNPKLAPAGSDWKETLKTCGTFNTVGTFWPIFNNIKPASKISIGSNYSIFRHGIVPSWEDTENVNGGKFVLTIPKKESRLGKCDESWLFSILAVIGETMDATGDQVNGAVVSIRKSQDRVAIWLKSSDREICVRIGERWKVVLGLEKTTLRFQSHKDAASSGRSFRNESQFKV